MYLSIYDGENMILQKINVYSRTCDMSPEKTTCRRQLRRNMRQKQEETGCIIILVSVQYGTHPCTDLYLR